jgi:hypothetical protein
VSEQTESSETGGPSPLDFSHMQSMNELDVGEEIANYIATQGGDDIDLFDSDREPRRESSSSGAETAEALTDDAEDEDKRQASQPEPEPEAKAEDSTDDDPDDAGPEIEAATVAALLGVDEDQLIVNDDGTLALATTVDGERGRATLTELVKGYQTEANVTRRSQEVARYREQLDQEYAQRQQELSQVTQNTLALGKVMHDRVMSKYEGVDWPRLRVEDPGEYAALQQQMSMETTGIQNETQQLLQQQQVLMQQQQQEQQQEQQKWIKEQQTALFEHLPELSAEDSRTPILNEYHKYLSGYGFADEEVQGILDHRMLRVINDAVRYKRGLVEGTNDGEGTPTVPLAKRLKSVPRVRKPGAATSERQNTRDRSQAAQRRLAESGSDRDAALAFIESGVVDNLL